ncbi:MAG: GNAT family N-acetyltransferase [Anaerolineales bacterium]|nr:GNAT family N-acetyltransferase [Anaerolineales bacterium]
MADLSFTTHLCISQKEYEATAAGMQAMLEGLGNNILKHLGNVELGKSLRIFLQDAQEKVVGGIAGDIFGGWVYISLLWVDEPLRNQGYGAELLKRFEAEAIRSGCKHAHVDTYSFEARPFYERAGYRVFGVLDDYPAGHQKFFLRKALIGG